MLTVTYDRFGDPADVLRTAEADAPVPAAGEALLRMSLSPIHHHDLWTIRGSYGVRPALPSDARRIFDLVAPYAERRILIAKELISYFEAIQEFLVAELPQDDPTRETVMNGSFLRASLFTSVVSFGVAAMAMGSQ